MSSAIYRRHYSWPSGRKEPAQLPEKEGLLKEKSDPSSDAFDSDQADGGITGRDNCTVEMNSHGHTGNGLAREEHLIPNNNGPEEPCFKRPKNWNNSPGEPCFKRPKNWLVTVFLVSLLLNVVLGLVLLLHGKQETTESSSENNPAGTSAALNARYLISGCLLTDCICDNSTGCSLVFNVTLDVKAPKGELPPDNECNFWREDRDNRNFLTCNGTNQESKSSYCDVTRTGFVNVNKSCPYKCYKEGDCSSGYTCKNFEDVQHNDNSRCCENERLEEYLDCCFRREVCNNEEHCKNGGRCHCIVGKDKDENPTCQCPPGYEGDDCGQEKVTEHLSLVCKNYTISYDRFCDVNSEKDNCDNRTSTLKPGEICVKFIGGKQLICARNGVQPFQVSP